MKIVGRSVFIGVCSLFLATAASAEEIDVAGLWLSAPGTSVIRITDCGNATPCGAVAWIDPAEAPADQRDIYNPDPALRDRMIVGLTILEGFSRKNDRWVGGSIYDPETGKTYGARLKLKEDGTLELKGCIGPFCQTRLWTQISDLPTD